MNDSRPQPRFEKGDAVRLKSRPDRNGVVSAAATRISGEFWYPIFFGPNKTSSHPEKDLELSELTTDVKSMFREGRFASRDAFTKLYAYLRLAISVRSQIYSMGASKTEFFSYQFKPLLKFLDADNHRLLIADEVGLGKTIEAGLILTELRKRSQLKRILVVVPSHLVLKWRDELRNRFQQEFDVLTRKDIEMFLSEFEDYGDETSLKGILSLQTLRSKSLIERWEAVLPHLDIVIFDEAGRLRNTGTLSSQAAFTVIDNSDGALLLTATPVQTGDRDLFNLLQLLAPEDFDSYELFLARLRANVPVLDALRMLQKMPVDLSRCAKVLMGVEKTPLSKRFVENPLYNDILERLQTSSMPTRQEVIELQRDISVLSLLSHIVNRTRKIEVQEARPMRQARVISVNPSEDEIQFYDLMTQHCYMAYASSKANNIGKLVAVTRQRQVASCISAAIEYFQDTSSTSPIDVEISDLRIEDEEVENGNGHEFAGNQTPTIDIALWKEKLTKYDSKFSKFLNLLQYLEEEEPGRKVVVFTYFKKTISYLQQKLQEAGISSELISGDVHSDLFNPSADIRGQRLKRFKYDPAVRILLTTEVGGEGIDLQFCHILINYDLPWNPMVVEQRIGRLDRIGQRSDKILIFNLSLKGTVEDRILDRLYKRIGIFEKSIGDLEAILGEVVQSLVRDLFSRHLSPEEQRERIEKAANVILKKQIELAEFEREATALVGHDEFFIDQINKAKEYKKYIEGNELILYLRDFLQQHHKGCRLKALDKGIFRLDVDETLRSFIRDNHPSDDLSLRLFISRSMNGSIILTTDQEYASENSESDLLTFYHPIVTAVTTYYTRHETELHPVSYVRLPAKSFSEGLYVWFLYLVDIGGARPSRDLIYVAFSLYPTRALSEDDCEILLGEMVTGAKMVTPGEREIVGLPAYEISEIADETFMQRLNERLFRVRKANNALVSNQLASLEESFLRKNNQRQKLLERARANQRKDTYIKGLETSIRNLTINYEKKKQEIEHNRTISPGYELKGAGVVEVISGRGLEREA